MNRPMNKRLVDTLDSIVDKEKKKHAIVFEFMPDKSKTKEAHISLLDQIDHQVRELESAVGKEKRLTHYTFELHGLNMKTAVGQMVAWIHPILTEMKYADRHFDEANNKIKSINDHLKRKMEPCPITLQQLKELKDLYDLYKGLLKYENIISRSLTLSRTHERLGILREHRPFDLESCDQRTSQVSLKTTELRQKVTKVSTTMRDQLSSINQKMVELENSVKSIL